MRSCLLSPKYYQVVNRVLTSLISSDEHNLYLRATVIHFLNKIMKLDREFISLILKDINLEKFLKINLFDGDQSNI